MHIGHRKFDQKGWTTLMIGISASYCIRDIVDGKVAIEKVEKIVSGIIARTPEDVTEVARLYKETCWSEKPEECEKVFRNLLEIGKIEQPRLQDREHYPLLYGYIEGPFTIWVNSESDIRWNDKDR